MEAERRSAVNYCNSIHLTNIIRIVIYTGYRNLKPSQVENGRLRPGYFVTGTGVTRDLSREAKGLSAIQTGRHLFGPDYTMAC